VRLSAGVLTESPLPPPQFGYPLALPPPRSRLLAPPPPHSAQATDLGPVRAAEVERFDDRLFELIRESAEEPCAIKGITPARAQAIHSSFAQVSSIANVDSWLRHIGLGKADARRVREAYGDDAARLVRENPHRLANDIHVISFLTADSLRLMLGIARISTFRLHATLKYVFGLVARTEDHASLPLGEPADRTPGPAPAATRVRALGPTPIGRSAVMDAAVESVAR